MTDCNSASLARSASSMRLRSVRAWKLHIGALQPARPALERGDVHQHRHPRPVGLLDNDLGAHDRLTGAQHGADRRGGKGQGSAVGLIAPKAGAALLVRIADPGCAAPQLDGAAVVTNERAFRRAHAKARRNGIQRSLVEIDKDVDAGRCRGRLPALTTHCGFPHSTQRGAGGQVPLGSVFFPFHWHGYTRRQKLQGLTTAIWKARGGSWQR